MEDEYIEFFVKLLKEVGDNYIMDEECYKRLLDLFVGE